MENGMCDPIIQFEEVKMQFLMVLKTIWSD